MKTNILKFCPIIVIFTILFLFSCGSSKKSGIDTDKVDKAYEKFNNTSMRETRD